MIKFQNNKVNRKLLLVEGYEMHDPHCTFNHKAWIIIGTDDKLYGVNYRNFPVVTVKEFLDKGDS